MDNLQDEFTYTSTAMQLEKMNHEQLLETAKLILKNQIVTKRMLLNEMEKGLPKYEPYQ